MSPQDTLRRAILNDEFPDDPDTERLFTPVGEDLLKLNRNIALSAWMSQVSRSDINAGSSTWQADKDALVQGYFKNPTASNVSDEQLHSLVKTHIQTSEEAADMAANMALQGKTSFEALKELNTKRGPSLVRPIWDRYTQDLVQRHSVLATKLAPYRGIVDAASSKLGKTMQENLPASQDFRDVATQLLQVPEEDRNLVISAIGATGGATAEERASYLSKLAGAMGRMTETMGAAIASDVESASLAETVVSLQEAGQPEFARKMEKNIEGRQELNLLTQQIRQVADSEVSPIKGDNWWSQTGIDVARMAPQVAVTVANPAIGAAANLSYFRATVAAEAKQEDPSLTYQQADTIGALTAPFNAAIETVTALIPFGKVKLPFVQKWLSTTTTSVKGAARNLVIRGAFGVASEVGEEMAQAVAPLWTQELLGALSKDMPGVDWEKRMPDFSKIAAQTWGPALVFGLVGGGAASSNDIKNGRALASDRDTMVATGMAPAMADQIATAAESGDWSKADSLFRQEFTSTTKATDEEKTAAVARIMEAQKAQDGFRSSSERGADELERAQTIEKAIESLSRARVFRDAEGWAVEDTATNEVVRVGSREEAANLAYSRLDDNAREEAQAMAKVFEAYSSGADILDLDLGRTMDLSETGDSEAAMKEAAMTEAMLNGMTREQAEKVTWTVLGSNRLETVEGVRRAVSRLFSGASVMDAIEEPVEARFQAGLEQGVFTSDEAMNFVRIAAEVMRAPELVTTAESSSRGLVEAISDIVMADTFGQRKDGRKGVAGAVTAGLKARLRRQAELSGAESKFAAFLAAFRHFFKQVFKRSRALLKARKEGKLTNDFDEFLDTLMNVDPQRSHDAAAAKEALEIAQAGNMAFSIAPKEQDAEYLAAVKSGDMVKAQRMVDEAANKAGYNKKLFTGQARGLSVIPKAVRNELPNAYAFLTDDREVAAHYSGAQTRAGDSRDMANGRKGRTYRTFTRLEKTLDLDQTPDENWWTEALAEEGNWQSKLERMLYMATDEQLQKLASTYHVETTEDGEPRSSRSIRDEVENAMVENPKSKWVKKAKTQEAMEQFGFEWDDDSKSFKDSEENEVANFEEALTQAWDNIKNQGYYLQDALNDSPLGQLLVLSPDSVVERFLEEGGYDSYSHTDTEVGGTTYIVFSPEQIKSADPVTYDDNGNVIPLSQRFQTDSSDIRYSLAPRSLPEVADTILAAQMKKPAFFEAFVTLARRKMDKLRKDGDWRVDKRGIASRKVGFDTRMGGIRSADSIENERKFRLRSRQRELIEQGMNALSPETLAAYDQGLTTLEDQPLISAMLNDHGKLMSKTTAEKLGKLKTDGKGNAGDFDDAPRLPIAWYSKGAGIMPDVMAENLGFDSVPAFWDALRSAIYTAKTANDAFKKARDAVRKVETDALAQARKESDKWAKDETAKIPSEKERQMMALRTIDAILSAFPPEIRAKVGGFVKLASFSTDKSREAEITRRLEKLGEVIEEEAKKHYAAKIGKMLDRYKSQKDSSGRITGKLISTATEQVDYAAQIADLDVAAQSEKGDALESLIEKSDDADVVQDALNKLGILRMFETMDMKDSLALESASDWLESTIEQGKLGKKIVDEARKEFLDDMREQAQAQVLDGKALNIDDANNLTNMNRAPMLAMVQRLRGMMSEALWTTAQRLEIIFGEGSKVFEYFAGQVVAAANKSNDIKRAVSAQQREILSAIFGSESKFAHAKGIAKLQKPRKSGVMVRRPVTKDVTLDMETLTKLADGTMTPETAGIREDELQTAMDEWAASDRKRSVTITQVVNVGEETDRFMSELQGIQWRLWWNQADSKKQMERDGWSDESIKQLDAFLSDEAKALGMWISDSYGEAAKMIDPVYRRLFNAPLPRIKGYAPIYRMTLSTSADVMDLGNSDMNSGLAAGFTKSRVNTTAPLLEIDALAAFLSHWENVSHWVSHAELMRDMKAILLDKNVSTAIRQKKGDGALSRLKEDVKTIESNGTNSAKELTSLSRGWRWLMQYRAYKGLAFRISPIMKQAPALLNPLLADVPAHNYAAGLARAFTSPQEFAANVSAMWKSDVVQRRIDGGFSAEAKIAQQGASMTGSQAIVFMQAGMMPMAYVDAGWTAMGAAIAFDYYKRSYMAQNEGATPEMADAAATARLERMIATSAQPSDVYARALYERSGNPFMRSMAMFVSDQRKALAIEVLALRKLITGKSKNKALDVQRVLVAHFIQAAVSQTMAGALASMFGDDDDSEREWSTEQWTLALTLGPVNGLFVLGRLIDKVGRGLLGLRIFPNNDLAGKAADDLIRGTKSMDELFNPDDAEDVMTSLDALSAAAGSVGSGLFGPAAGAVDVSANLVREGIKITKALAEED